MKLNNLRDLFLDQLRDLYSAETQLLKAIPKMSQKATDPKLKESFDQHLKETHGQIEKLDKVFGIFGEKSSGHRCKAMAGIIEETEELMGYQAPPEVMDAGLIAEAQRVEHYEIAGYGTLKALSAQLGESQATSLLESILRQEKMTDRKLTQSAESSVNPKASEV